MINVTHTSFDFEVCFIRKFEDGLNKMRYSADIDNKPQQMTYYFMDNVNLSNLF